MSCSAELSMNSYYLGARLRICAVSFVSLFNPFQAGNSFKKQVQTLQTQLRHSNVFFCFFARHYLHTGISMQNQIKIQTGSIVAFTRLCSPV